MKTIAIITDSAYKNDRPNNVGTIMKKNILEVLEQEVIIKIYFINQLHKDSHIAEDLIIIMARSRALKIKQYVKNQNNIIIAKRTFLKQSLNQLSTIPENSDVLVVNDNIETVLDSVSTLYNIGIKHINLIPYEKGKDYHHIKYALSPAEPELIPDYIENKYNLQHRVIDISTMLLIISKLKIDNKKVQKNLYNYYQKIFSTNQAITKNYQNLLTRTEELNHLLNLSNDGILLTNSNGKILISNKKFKEMFGIYNTIENKYVHEIIQEIDFKKYYNKKDYDVLISYNKKHLNLNKKIITHFNKKTRIYFNFQEVTYIKKLEQNLSHKLRQKGHIARYTFDDYISKTDVMTRVIKMAKKISDTDLTILITGESGTGKEVIAQAIHNASSRKNQPFIAVNAAAIPENLLESELFGYSKGSFTGASKKGKKGLFEKANNGTIFLDEIGDMAKHLQTKLLRVLQEQQITPIGSDRIIDIDVRIIAATHKNPRELIKSEKFRKDLFYRINEFSLNLPPLRKRPKDIPLLLKHFTNYQYDCNEKCINFLKNYDWPGNIRELKNVAKYISTLEESKTIRIESLPDYLSSEYSNFSDSSVELLAKENFILKEKVDLNTSIIILHSIAFLNQINKTAGRKHLLELLEKKNLDISVSYLRKTLKTLKSLDFIIIKKGRSGSYITDKGKLFLSENSELADKLVDKQEIVT